MDPFSIIIGGLITLAASWFFYRKASEDLRKEATRLRQASRKLSQEVDDLRRYNIVMLRLFDDIGRQTGLIGVRFDSKGEPIGLNLQRTAKSSVGMVDSESHQSQDSPSSSAEESNDR